MKLGLFTTWGALLGPELGTSSVVAFIGAAAMIFAQRQFWSAHA